MEQQSKQMNVTSYKTENIGSLQPIMKLFIVPKKVNIEWTKPPFSFNVFFSSSDVQSVALIISRKFLSQHKVSQLQISHLVDNDVSLNFQAFNTNMINHVILCRSKGIWLSYLLRVWEIH